MMRNIVLFTCKQEEEQKEKKRSFFRYLYEVFVERTKEPGLDELMVDMELFEDINFCLMRLPVTIGEIALKAAKLEKLGLLLRAGYENVTCIVPERMSGSHPFRGCISNAFTGKILFRSLLNQIIDEIYGKKNIEIRALDISIIQGDSFNELYTVLNQLSPYVKFLTVITEEKEQAEENAARIYDDTGLSIRVTNEYRSGMKNADLIINLASSKEFIFNARINPAALIINYGDINFNKILSGNIIINGIDVGFPQSLHSKICKYVFEYYGKIEIAEILLSYRTLLSDKILEGAYDFDMADIFSKEFRKSGFAITGFLGRRNIFKAKDIKIYGT